MMLPKALQRGSFVSRKPDRPPPKLGQGRLKERTPVAVIDIGSNSVRQVIYEGLTRAPSVLFNEKVLCGLGAGVATTGRLNDAAVERAMCAIRRFVALQDQTHTCDVHIIATAAAREAENGAEFIARVEAATGQSVELLTGPLEAWYAALGVVSGFHQPEGIAGDMGGGSLELIGIDRPEAEGLTLPFGGLRLHEMSGGSLDKAKKIVRKGLRETTVDWPGKRRTFYAVGGTWRSLGKLHIANHQYPMDSVHDYEIPATEMSAFCERVGRGDLSGIKGIRAVSKNRRELLPYGAIVLREIIRRLKPKTIAISSLGVREGFLHSRLCEEEQAKDSLLVAARDLSILRARSPDHCLELAEWTGKAFAELGIKESANERRYRIAACYLADVGWRAHSDFRAQQTLEVIANAGFVGIDHEGRAYLAIANYHRFKGLSSKIGMPKTAILATEKMQRKARILAGMFRVLYLFSASMPGVIPLLAIERRSKKSAAVTLPASLKGLCGERPDGRISELGKEVGIQMALEIASDTD